MLPFFQTNPKTPELNNEERFSDLAPVRAIYFITTLYSIMSKSTPAYVGKPSHRHPLRSSLLLNNSIRCHVSRP